VRKVGIWIDHRKAVVVTIDGGQESQQVVESDIDDVTGPEGSRRTSTAYGPQAKDVERQVQDKKRHHLARFYKDIVKRIGKPDQLLVIGPAEAKREFAELAEKDPALRGVKIKLEPADRMTDAQIAAKVRETDV